MKLFFRKKGKVFLWLVSFFLFSTFFGWTAFTYGIERAREIVAPDADGHIVGSTPEFLPGTEAPMFDEFFPALGNAPAAGNLLFDQSHNSVFASSFPSKFPNFILLAQSLGFNVIIANDFNNMANYDVYLMIVPQTAYSPGDITVVQNYLNGGGILLMMGEWPDWYSNNYILNNLLSSLGAGIQIVEDTIEDPAHHYGSNTKQIYVHEMSTHCLVDNVSEVFHPATTSLSVTNPASVLYSSDTTSFLSGAGTPGPLPIAAIPDPTAHPTWRMIVVGDTSHFADFGFPGSDNSQLATNELLWCEDCEEDPDCDDGEYCNGVETCDIPSGNCLAGTPPCNDDGLWCNGGESCDEINDQCISSGDPCPSDGVFCNGDESCDEASDSCLPGTDHALMTAYGVMAPKVVTRQMTHAPLQGTSALPMVFSAMAMKVVMRILIPAFHRETHVPVKSAMKILTSVNPRNFRMMMTL